ncbi:MAG: universal stress protein, partial [Chloroflexota bacterium]
MVTPGYIQAREDFRKARRQAALEQLLSRLRGKPSELLSYDEVRRLVGAQSRIERGLEEIPVDAIVGSVGRYADFTRTFLPRTDQM